MHLGRKKTIKKGDIQGNERAEGILPHAAFTTIMRLAGKGCNRKYRNCKKIAAKSDCNNLGLLKVWAILAAFTKRIVVAH